MHEHLIIGGPQLVKAIKQNETLVLLTACANNLYDHIEILIAQCPNNTEFLLDSLMDNSNLKAFRKAITLCDKKLAFMRAIKKSSISFWL